jgi:phage baseplate assembly protein W
MPFDDPFLGTGWSFPPTFDAGLAEVEMTSGVADIEKSLEIIYTTALGERIMNPAFGCSLEDMVFEPMNTSRITYIENLLRTAILYHEPRIDADKIEVIPDDFEGILLIKIGYTVRTTNSRFNFVYPYYMNPTSS